MASEARAWRWLLLLMPVALLHRAAYGMARVGAAYAPLEHGRDWELDRVALSLASHAHWVGYLLTAALCWRLPPKLVLCLGAAIFLAGAGLLAASPELAQVGLVVIELGHAVIALSFWLVLARMFGAGERHLCSVAFVGLVLAYTLGTVVGSTALELAHRYVTRSGWVVLVAAAAAAVAVFAWAACSSPRERVSLVGARPVLLRAGVATVVWSGVALVGLVSVSYVELAEASTTGVMIAAVSSSLATLAAPIGLYLLHRRQAAISTLQLVALAVLLLGLGAAASRWGGGAVGVVGVALWGGAAVVVKPLLAAWLTFGAPTRWAAIGLAAKRCVGALLAYLLAAAPPGVTLYGAASGVGLALALTLLATARSLDAKLGPPDVDAPRSF